MALRVQPLPVLRAGPRDADPMRNVSQWFAHQERIGGVLKTRSKINLFPLDSGLTTPSLREYPLDTRSDIREAHHMSVKVGTTVTFTFVTGSGKTGTTPVVVKVVHTDPFGGFVTSVEVSHPGSTTTFRVSPTTLS